MLERFLSDLKRLVAVRSVRGEALPFAPYGEGPRKALDVAAEIIKEHGFEPRITDDVALDFDYNGEQTALAILAHLDVVHEGEGWDSDPYEVVEKDGRYYGRGVSDDKGPALCALYALSQLKDEGVRLKNNVRVIFGSDEECGSDDLKRYFAKNKPPKYLFSPDAQYPVVNTEKGRMHLEVCAQNKSDLAEIKGGTAANIVANRAYAVVKGRRAHDIKTKADDCEKMTGVHFELSPTPDGVRITAIGRSAHASTPDEGNNAITALLFLLSKMGIMTELSALLPHGKTDGETFGIKCSDDLSGELTLSPNIIDGNEDCVKVTCDVRVPVSRDDMYKNIRDVGEIKVSVVSHTDGHHVPADSLLVRALNDAYEKISGRKGGTVALGGGTYVHDMEKYGCEGVAFGACLPETDTRMHGANEFAVRDELVMSVEIFKEAIKNICGVYDGKENI